MEGVIAYWTLLALKQILTVLDLMLGFLFGWTIREGTKQQRMTSQDYEHSAHMVRVMARARYGSLIAPGEDNFLWRHDSYVNPRLILQKCNIFIFSLNTTHALFAVTDPNINIYNTAKYSFMFMVFNVSIGLSCS